MQLHLADDTDSGTVELCSGELCISADHRTQRVVVAVLTDEGAELGIEMDLRSAVDAVLLLVGSIARLQGWESLPDA